MKLNQRLFCLAAALAALPLAAQQSVDASKPLGAPPDQGPMFESHEIHGPEGLKPSGSIFSSGKPLPFYDKLAGSPPPAPISPAQAQQVQKFLDDQKNWTLLTPEEIMGLPTERNILGLPESDDDKNLTASQRYLKRLDAQEQALAATNSLQAKNPLLLDGDNGQPGTDDSSQNSLFGSKVPGMQTDIWGRRINPAGPNVPDQQRDSIWKSAFAHPPALPKPDPQQVAEMERFRVLIGSVTPEKPLTPMPALQPIAPAPDPNMQQLPAFNPNGNSYTEVKESVYKPTGIMPLPGIATRPLEPAKKPESATKLPPWLSHQTPQPGTIQRVF